MKTKIHCWADKLVHISFALTFLCTVIFFAGCGEVQNLQNQNKNRIGSNPSKTTTSTPTNTTTTSTPSNTTTTSTPTNTTTTATPTTPTNTASPTDPSTPTTTTTVLAIFVTDVGNGGQIVKVEKQSGAAHTIAFNLGTGLTGLASGKCAPNDLFLTRLDYPGSGSPGSVTRIDEQTGYFTNLVTGLATPHGIVYDCANNRLFVSEAGAGRVVSIDIAAPASVELIIGLNTPSSLVLDNDQLYIVENTASKVSVFDLTTSTLQMFVLTPDRPAGLALAKTRNEMYIGSGGGASTSAIWKVDLATRQVVKTFTQFRSPGGMWVDENENLLYVYTSDGLQTLNLDTEVDNTLTQMVRGGWVAPDYQ